MISRRNFLSLAAAALLTQQKSADMIVRSIRPEDLEMPPEGMNDFITTAERFFVRSHVTVLTVELSQWHLNVDGNVATPLTLSMEDLRKMPAVELIGVLECAGNGRAFFEPLVPGLQWANGAVGNGRWRGVPLSELLRR